MSRELLTHDSKGCLSIVVTAEFLSKITESLNDFNKLHRLTLSRSAYCRLLLSKALEEEPS